MQSFPAYADILIVGAGPTGLALAGELKRLGTDALVIDRQEAGANTSRACVVHAATMEALAPLGATADLLDLGVKVPIFRVRDRDRTLITIDFAELPTDYPFTLMLPQNRIEACLEERLNKLGGIVRRGCELVEITDRRDHVETRLLVAGDVRLVRAKWLIGCDGMHSLVRSQSGIPFAGGEYGQDFVLADVRMDWPLGQGEVTLFYAAAGLMVVAPLPEGHYRIVATVNEAPENVTASFIQSIVDERGPTQRAGLTELAWSSRFHVHHRLAESPRKGFILLCGDAAHVHSPAGGQGMNTGIQDAVSLARELVALRQDGDLGRLDRWAEKRHEVAAKVVALTDRMTRAATLRSPAAKVLRNLAVAFAGHVPAVRTAFARALAELDAR